MICQVKRSWLALDGVGLDRVHGSLPEEGVFEWSIKPLARMERL